MKILIILLFKEIVKKKNQVKSVWLFRCRKNISFIVFNSFTIKQFIFHVNKKIIPILIWQIPPPGSLG